MKKTLGLVLAALTVACGGSGTITGKANAQGATDSSIVKIKATGPETLETTAAADGSYKFEGVDEGDYTIEASATGYKTETKTVKVPPGNVDTFNLAKQ
jgi:hypothetical protein